jgi:predicted GH43/DUF377 family glycosyl hydrolase
LGKIAGYEERELTRTNAKNEKQRAKLRQFEADVDRGFSEISHLEGIEAVVGIPFYDEDDTLPGVVQTARRGLSDAGLSGKALVVCVGPDNGESALEAAARAGGPDCGVALHGFLRSRGEGARGSCSRAILEIASRLGASLVILPPDISPQSKGGDESGQGFSPSWIKRLLEPIREHEHDLALPRFSRDPLSRAVESFLAYPVVTGVYGFRLRQPTPGVMAVAHRLVRSCIASPDFWGEDPGAYGFDPWLVTHALAGQFSICEAPLGAAAFKHRVGKLKPAFRQVAHSLLSQIARHSRTWLERPDPVAAPWVSGAYLEVMTPRLSVEPKEILRRFKLEFDHFDHTLVCEIVPDEFRHRMERLADQGRSEDALSAEDWIEVLRQFLVAFKFERQFHPDDIVDALFPFFLARLAGFIFEIRRMEEDLTASGRIDPITVEGFVRHHAERVIDRQADLFIAAWPEFRRHWRERQAERATYLPMLGAWEFVPHVRVIVPQELEKPAGERVYARDIYQHLIDRYRGEFTDFLREQLGMDGVASSSEILSRVQGFMNNVDWALDTKVYPYNLASVDGTRKMTGEIFAACSDGTPTAGGAESLDETGGRTFQLRPEVAERVLRQAVPRNLIMQLGLGNVGALLKEMDPRDALGMASWTDRQLYLEQVLDILEKHAEPKWFYLAPLEPVVVDPNRFSSLTELRGITSLARPAGRVMVACMQKGWGGEYPKLWFLLNIVKTMVGVEHFSRIWQRLAREKSDFGKRLVASIRGHWGRHVLSAHNAFENQQQRTVAERLTGLAGILEKERGKEEAGRLLRAVARVYHLSITLPDNTFVPLSAWTWTSYSARGGFGTPTPLSSLVERDWATRDFIGAYLEAAGLGDDETIDEKIFAMISEGRESENLRDELPGLSAEPDEIVLRQAHATTTLPAGKLTRPVDKPILEPMRKHAWESKYVLNAAAVRLDGTVYILYRAFGDDEVSRIGLAWTKDGINVDGRLDEPIYFPRDPSESAGTEDPRVTVIGDRLYMLYTAWDRRVPQIAMASIPVEAFLERDFEKWERHGLGFPGLPNKDAVLYPQRFNGQYVVYHRIDPDMWISYLDSLACPWPKTGQKIVTGPRPGMMWDSIKVGAGAQPIRTKHGWLNIYHGVDYERTYRLGVLFMALDDPSNVIYQSPNPILEPEMSYEIGKTGDKEFWVPQVVFTCGAVSAVEKDVLDLDDEILVYYGAADSAIGVAKGRLIDLVPVLGDDTGAPR